MKNMPAERLRGKLGGHCFSTFRVVLYKKNQILQGDIVREFGIREAAVSDADAIAAICSADLGYPCTVSLVRRKLESLDPRREAVYVAVAGGAVVGYVHVEKYDVLYFETMANILGLAVRSAYRHIGVGRALVAAAEAWALQNGIKMMRLNSGKDRSNAHDFYRNLGYTSEKEQIRFMKKLRP